MESNIDNGTEIISIHTPAKGVTSNDQCGPVLPSISIHTPAKGVTSRSTSCFPLRRIFQSTPPRRG